MSAGQITQGRRADVWGEMQAGSYIPEGNGSWCVWGPGWRNPCIIGEPASRHGITEHEDRTLTVTGSILVTAQQCGVDWHGYLERGVWREV